MLPPDRPYFIIALHYLSACHWTCFDTIHPTPGFIPRLRFSLSRPLPRTAPPRTADVEPKAQTHPGLLYESLAVALSENLVPTRVWNNKMFSKNLYSNINFRACRNRGELILNIFEVSAPISHARPTPHFITTHYSRTSSLLSNERTCMIMRVVFQEMKILRMRTGALSITMFENNEASRISYWRGSVVARFSRFLVELPFLQAGLLSQVSGNCWKTFWLHLYPRIEDRKLFLENTTHRINKLSADKKVWKSEVGEVYRVWK